MIRTLPAILLIFILLRPSSAAPAEHNQLDGNEALFTILAAMNAAGYDAEIDSLANSPLRKAIRDHLAQQKLPVVEELKKFFATHRQKDNSAEFSQYVSFALCVQGVPEFKYRMKPSDLPPDVLPLEGLGELMARFYQDANIPDIWAKSQPQIDKIIAAYQPLVTQGVMQTNAYLRNPTSGATGRRFDVLIDVLGAPNQVQTRSYRDDYFIVVTPSVDPQADQVRHGYMHYLLDPVVLRSAESLARKRSLVDFATGAPALDDSYKDDFFLLTSECLIKAVEAKLTPGAAKKQALINQALEEGFIYTAAFYEGFPAYEKQDLAFRYYFKDLVEAIDVRAEAKRLDGVKFVREKAGKSVKAVQPPPPAPVTGVFKVYEGAEVFYKERKLGEARDAYLEVLKSPDQQSLHAKAYYGLARIAALQRDGELAERMFQKSLALGPDDETRAWTLVYLGRLADAHGEREQATDRYKSALALKGASSGARQAAEQGLKQSFSNKK